MMGSMKERQTAYTNLSQLKGSKTHEQQCRLSILFRGLYPEPHLKVGSRGEGRESKERRRGNVASSIQGVS